MITLPHALPEAIAGPASPASGRGALVRTDVAAGSVDNGFVVVETTTGLETLRPALHNGAAGIALVGWRTGADIQRLSVLLSVAEAESRLAEGSTAILAVTDGLLPAHLSPQGLSNTSARLAALVWNHALLTRTLGANRALADDGEWTGAFAAARAAVLLAAGAAGIPAYDSVSDLSEETFAAACERSRDDGFFGRLARDRVQASIIQTIYGRGASSNRA